MEAVYIIELAIRENDGIKTVRKQVKIIILWNIDEKEIKYTAQEISA